MVLHPSRTFPIPCIPMMHSPKRDPSFPNVALNGGGICLRVRAWCASLRQAFRLCCPYQLQANVSSANWEEPFVLCFGPAPYTWKQEKSHLTFISISLSVLCQRVTPGGSLRACSSPTMHTDQGLIHLPMSQMTDFLCSLITHRYIFLYYLGFVPFSPAEKFPENTIFIISTFFLTCLLLMLTNYSSPQS